MVCKFEVLQHKWQQLKGFALLVVNNVNFEDGMQAPDESGITANLHQTSTHVAPLEPPCCSLLFDTRQATDSRSTSWASNLSARPSTGL